MMSASFTNSIFKPSLWSIFFSLVVLFPMGASAEQSSCNSSLIEIEKEISFWEQRQQSLISEYNVIRDDIRPPLTEAQGLAYDIVLLKLDAMSLFSSSLITKGAKIGSDALDAAFKGYKLASGSYKLYELELTTKELEDAVFSLYAHFSRPKIGLAMDVAERQHQLRQWHQMYRDVATDNSQQRARVADELAFLKTNRMALECYSSANDEQVFVIEDTDGDKTYLHSGVSVPLAEPSSVEETVRSIIGWALYGSEQRSPNFSLGPKLFGSSANVNDIVNLARKLEDGGVLAFTVSESEGRVVSLDLVGHGQGGIAGVLQSSFENRIKNPLGIPYQEAKADLGLRLIVLSKSSDGSISANFLSASLSEAVMADVTARASRAISAIQERQHRLMSLEFQKRHNSHARRWEQQRQRDRSAIWAQENGLTVDGPNFSLIFDHGASFLGEYDIHFGEGSAHEFDLSCGFTSFVQPEAMRGVSAFKLCQ